MDEVIVLVVGWSPPVVVDEVIARRKLEEVFQEITIRHPTHEVTLAAGLTYAGANKIAYDLASMLGWKTIGVACSKAYEHEVFPVDEEVIIGEKWGDESEHFTSLYLNHTGPRYIIFVAGGKQAKVEFQECEKAGMGFLYYFDLPRN